MTLVLIVEDNTILLENIGFELEMAGYEVVQAVNGLDAFQKLQNGLRPQIIVSDISMPEMDGFQLLEAVRSVDALAPIPFIFLTALDSANAIRTGRDLGVDDYLVKPFEPEDLVHAMENKLKRYRQINQEAERRLDGARRDLLNLISHELRTPLTAIYGSTEILSEILSDVPDDMTHKMLELLQSGTNRMNQLVTRIIHMVQIESGFVKSLLKEHGRAQDLNQETQNILGSYEHEKVEIYFEPSPEPVRVISVEPFLGLMIDELIANAVKFSNQNGRVFISVARDGDDALLIVRDEGVGIPVEKQELLWKHFSQVNRAAMEQQGIGLGLTLVQGILNDMGGSCRIESELDQGTEVVVRLPLAR